MSEVVLFRFCSSLSYSDRCPIRALRSSRQKKESAVVLLASVTWGKVSCDFTSEHIAESVCLVFCTAPCATGKDWCHQRPSVLRPAVCDVVALSCWSSCWVGSQEEQCTVAAWRRQSVRVQRPRTQEMAGRRCTTCDSAVSTFLEVLSSRAAQFFSLVFFPILFSLLTRFFGDRWQIMPNEALEAKKDTSG